MSDRFFVATRKGLFDFRRGSSGVKRKWELVRVSFLGEPVTTVLPDARDGAIYAALNLGHFGVKLHRSSDGAVRFEEIAAPRYPEKPEGSDDPTPWSLQQVWSLEAGGADEPGVLWAGTIPGGLFRSADRGDSWELVTSLWERPDRLEWTGGGYDQAGIHSICVDPRDSRRIALGVSIGGVWFSEDGGRSWEHRTRGMFAVYVPPDLREAANSQDPHRLAQCRAQPDVFWVQHHNAVFRSGDRGATWSEIADRPPSVFGFAAVVHPQDPDTAWFAPAVNDECRVPVDGRVVVARTRDGGASFEVLGEGLPQEHAYDLVYRHALAVDETGERLVMGSTTGSLWLSEDQGDSWLCLSTQLPPIDAVRFAARDAPA
ncbi:MAG: exo-alpha-sialidase [Myxococcota bacterium]